MKAKLKLDKTAVKNFFIDHAEKVVFGCVLLGVVLIIYGAATGSEKTTKKPEQLLAVVDQAKQKIEAEQKLEIKEFEVEKVAAANREKILEDPYQQTKTISPPIGRLEQPRGEPPVLGVEDLQVATNTGMFQITLAPTNPANEGDGAAAAPAAVGASDQRGQRWAVVTGLVPYKKQCEAFANTFQDAKRLGPMDSVPNYQGYRVERLEITSPSDVKNPNWNNSAKVTKFIFRSAERSAPKDWGLMGQMEPIEPRYCNRFLCFPLGPLVDGTWGAEVAHEPEIPLMTNAMYGGTPPAATEETDDKKPAESEREFGDQNPTAPGAGGGYGMMGMAAGGMPGMGMYGRGPMPGMVPGGMMGEATDTEYLLFRFFDFTVAPGKRYIYRVQLALSNPNYSQKAVYLQKPEFAKSEFLVEKKWSDPSPVISIPYDTSTLAMAVEQPRRPTSDPLGSMILALWQQDTGLKVYNQFAVERGQMLNFSEAEVKPAPHKQGSAILTPPENTKLLSNVLVVDIAGGKKLPMSKTRPDPPGEKDQFNKTLPCADRTLFSPGEFLVMDSDGTLAVRSELDDLVAVENYTTMPETMPGGAPPGHGMPPGYGPGMPGGYGPGMPGGYGPGMPGGYGPGMPGGYGPGMPGGYGPGMPGGYGPGMQAPRAGGRNDTPAGYGELFGPNERQPGRPRGK